MCRPSGWSLRWSAILQDTATFRQADSMCYRITSDDNERIVKNETAHVTSELRCQRKRVRVIYQKTTPKSYEDLTKDKVCAGGERRVVKCAHALRRTHNASWYCCELQCDTGLSSKVSSMGRECTEAWYSSFARLAEVVISSSSWSTWLRLLFMACVVVAPGYVNVLYILRPWPQPRKEKFVGSVRAPLAVRGTPFQVEQVI